MLIGAQAPEGRHKTTSPAATVVQRVWRMQFRPISAGGQKGSTGPRPLAWAVNGRPFGPHLDMLGSPHPRCPVENVGHAEAREEDCLVIIGHGRPVGLRLRGCHAQPNPLPGLRLTGWWDLILYFHAHQIIARLQAGGNFDSGTGESVAGLALAHRDGCGFAFVNLGAVAKQPGSHREGPGGGVDDLESELRAFTGREVA